MKASNFDSNADYYAVLGVTPSASLQEIKAAYRRTAKRAHPDKGGNHQWMIDVAAAWEVLSNPAIRKAYDQARSNPTDQGVRQEWQQAAQEAQARARTYPRSWDEFDVWLNHATAEVQAHPVGRVLAGMVAGLVVGVVIGTVVGLVVGVGWVGGGVVGSTTGIVVGAVIGHKQPAMR